MTIKLYWEVPSLSTFTARIVGRPTQNGQSSIVLDRTAFYPAGGGQPCDLGLIDSVHVIAVTSQADGTILHQLEGAGDFLLDQEVVGQIDVARRQELTQQHTGQHILSQAFFQLFGAETRGFRINSTTSEIDLTLDFSPESLSRAIRQAEDLSNRIVFENRKIRSRLVSPEEASQLPLRKESFITDCIRVVEIEDYDWSACGGTHAARTGEVGLIVVKGWERAKKMTRVEFLCGVRALQDYRFTNTTIDTIARKFSVSQDAVVAAVSRLIEDSKQLERRNRYFSEVTAKVEASTLLESATPSSGFRVIAKIFDDRSFDELKQLAHQLVKTASVIALLGVIDGKSARLVFACAPEVAVEMGTLMREACQSLGGKGGGTSAFAQGGSENVLEAEKVLEAVAQKLRQNSEEAR